MSDAYETLRLERDGAIAVVRIHRPEKRNALNATVRRELTACLDELAEDPRLRAVILTGSGEDAFVAGADVSEFAERSAEEQRRHSALPRVYERVASFPLPVIAAINGWCLGGGNELALACDVRVASTGARLGQPEVRLGLFPGGGGTQRLPRLVGPGHAARLVLTGDIVEANEARAMGLVDFVVEPQELLPFCRDLAGRMAKRSPVALRKAKEALRLAQELPLGQGLERESELFVSLFETEDMREGVRAFLEGREPEWTGR